MALLTSPGPIIRESIGSMTYILIPLTTGSTSDTYSIGTSMQIINAEFTGNSTTAGTSNVGDATYSATTGLITIVTANQGSGDLVLWCKA